MTQEDDQWRDQFKKMERVPFPESLTEQILQRAREDAPLPVRPLVHGKTRWKTLGVATAGVAVAGVIVASVLPVSKLDNKFPWVQNPLQSTATRQAQQSSAVTSEQGFGLQAALLNISKPQVVSGPGWPSNSYVQAQLQNLGTQPITNNNTFGILYFTPPGSNATSWTQSDSATFVNVLDSPAQKAINPGVPVGWSFHPVGAPHAPNGSLTQTPHLVFFQTGLVRASKADQFWPRAQVATKVISVVPTMWANQQGQNVDVNVSLTNTSNTSVQLRNLWFIIWFGQSPGEDFTQPGVVRFLDFVPPPQRSEVLPPQGQVIVHLREVGAASTNFGSLTAHVAAVSK